MTTLNLNSIKKIGSKKNFCELNKIISEERFDKITKSKIKIFYGLYNKGLFKEKKCRYCGKDHCKRILEDLSSSSTFDLFYSNMLGMTLSHAAKNGDIKLLKYLSRKHEGLRDKAGHVLLGACRTSKIDVLKYLFSTNDFFFRENPFFDDKKEALLSACRHDNTEIANLLIKNDKSLCKHKKCFYLACSNANILLVKIFLRNGDKQFLLDNEVLDHACSSGSILLVKYLLEQGATISKKSVSSACKSGNIKLLKFLQEKGVNLCSSQDESFMFAVIKSRWDIIDFLTEHGADIKKHGGLALRAASAMGDLTTVKFLIENNVDIHTNNEAALHSAIDHSQFEIANYLIENGANIHVNNDVILMNKSRFGSCRQLQFIIDHGVNININNGAVLAEICRNFSDRLELLACLKKAKFNFKKYGEQSLIDACKEGRLDIVKFLAKAGVNIYTNDGLAFISAIDNAHFEVADFLLHLDKKGIFKNLNLDYSENSYFGKKGSKALFIIKNGMRYYQTASIITNVLNQYMMRPYKLLALNENNKSNRYVCSMQAIKDLIYKYGFDTQEILKECLESVIFRSQFDSCCELIKLFLQLNLAYKTNIDIDNLFMSVCDAVEPYEAVKLLIEAGANIGEYKDQALIKVTQNSGKNADVRILKLLLKHGADVNCKTEYNSRPLHWAIIFNNFKYAKFLIDHGADVNLDEDEAILTACKNGNLKMIKLLLKHGANINPKSNSVIIQACQNDQYHIIKFLINHGAHFNMEYDHEWGPYKFQDNNQNVLILDYLWRTKNRIGDVCDEIIKLACKKNDYELIKFLLKKGVNKNNLAIVGLAHALELKNFLMATLFINLGADIHIDDDNLFRWASACRDQDIMSFLIYHGANINACNGEALLNACDQGDIELCQYLISHGADVNINNGQAILLACAEVKENYPNPFKVPINKFTKKHFEILMLLAANNADINSHSKTILQLMITRANLENDKQITDLIKYLVLHGADLLKINDTNLLWLDKKENPRLYRFLQDKVKSTHLH